MDDKDLVEIERITSIVGRAIDGEKAGHIIPALITMLAILQDDEIMSKVDYLHNVLDDLTEALKVIEVADAVKQSGDEKWLQ